MPKLPEENKGRDFELLDKNDFKRGTLDGSKPVIRKYHPKFPKKLVLGLLALVVVLVLIYVAATKISPFLLNKPVKTVQTTTATQGFEYPVDASQIKFPSDFIKNKFLENFQKASSETDNENRYPFLEANFKLLLNSYAQTQSYDLHVALDTYKAYIQKNYSDKYSQNKMLYDFPCLDKVCAGNVQNPAEIDEVKKSLTDNKAISVPVRDGILRNFDAAASSKDKNNQGTAYANALYSLFAEYQRTNDGGIKDAWQKLNDFISKNYPDIKIREELKIK